MLYPFKPARNHATAFGAVFFAATFFGAAFLGTAFFPFTAALTAACRPQYVIPELILSLFNFDWI